MLLGREKNWSDNCNVVNEIQISTLKSRCSKFLSTTLQKKKTFVLGYVSYSANFHFFGS